MVIRRRLQPVYGTHNYAGVSGGGMRPRSYSTVPTRTPYTSSFSRADSVAYDTRVEDYLLSSRVDDASYLSSAVLDDTYDTAKRSRGRDAKLLRDATNAIVSSESYATPQTSVVSRRVARGRSVVPSRAASVPPRPVSNAYREVDTSQSKGFTAASTTTTKATTYPRPIIVYSAPRRVESRAKSVPPVTFADAYYGYGEKVRKEPVGWRMRAQRASRARSVPRAESVPPRAKSVPHRYSSPPRVSQTSEYTGRRRRARPGYTRARSVEAIPPPPLPTASLFAHKVPRRFLTRSGIRTYFSNMRGYYQHGTPAKGGRDQDEKVRRGAVRTRFVATPAARVTPVNPVGHYFARARLYAALPKPKPASARESLSNFPQVYVPSRKGKPSNRAKAAIIASKLEPDPLKRRRPKSEFAAAKYRAMRKDHQESIYSGLPSSSGLSASNPPLSSERFRPRSTPNLSKVVIGRAFSQQVVTVPFKQVRKKSRFLGKPVKYFPSPYDFPDPRLHPKRPTETFDKKKGAKGEDDDRSGGGDEVRRSTVKIPDYYATGVDPRNPPVSDLRRRIRRTLNKTRNS